MMTIFRPSKLYAVLTGPIKQFNVRTIKDKFYFVIHKYKPYLIVVLKREYVY